MEIKLNKPPIWDKGTGPLSHMLHFVGANPCVCPGYEIQCRKEDNPMGRI